MNSFFPPTPHATFKVLTSFAVFGVGYVLVGDVLTGRVQAGDCVQLPLADGPVPHPILDVETVDRATEGTTHTGLILPYDAETELAALKALDLAGLVLSIVAA
ncbi:MAG TPA: hypothetical protein VF646_08455 [Cytophagales bacterium]|jgi:hypothetical protein